MPARHLPIALAILSLSVACKPVESKPPSGDEPLISGPEDPDHEAPAMTEDSPEPASTTAAPGSRPPHTIYRSEIERALTGGPAYLLRELGPEPFRMEGKFVGWELTAVYPDDPGLCDPGCDIAAGDVILSVNGDRLETPQALTDMLARLPKTDELVVKSLRNEKRRVVTYTIVDD
jgi:type II secretory pathway component PulC